MLMLQETVTMISNSAHFLLTNTSLTQATDRINSEEYKWLLTVQILELPKHRSPKRKIINHLRFKAILDTLRAET